MRRYAFLTTPHLGGTYRVFQTLRGGLASRGVEVRWVAVGAQSARVLATCEHPAGADEGELIAPEVEDECEQGRRLKRHLETGQYRGVFVGALCGRVENNCIRYLDPAVARIMIVHTTSVGAYAAARTLAPYVNAIVGVSVRVRDDLVARGIGRERVFAIPNGVAVDQFNPGAPRVSERLRLLYLGRLDDSSKGVLWLPKVMRRLRTAAHLTIVGDGPDRVRLEQGLRGAAVAAHLRTAVSSHQVPGILREHDVLLAPSRYEGFGQAIVEAMACAVVPVASRIRGVTDMIVDHGRDGCLFPIGDLGAAAAAIDALALDPARREQMARAARRAAVSRFSSERMASGYWQLLARVAQGDLSTLSPPLSIDDWCFPPALCSGMRTRLPEWVKSRGRRVREWLSR
ncbi:glycosyltransferase family 4 protein [Candidatus Thiodictyon syntrophicum]|nr:glycosyltransferase [Candidatus Thiodictyon syntrophicum]